MKAGAAAATFGGRTEGAHSGMEGFLLARSPTANSMPAGNANGHASFPGKRMHFGLILASVVLAFYLHS